MPAKSVKKTSATKQTEHLRSLLQISEKINATLEAREIAAVLTETFHRISPCPVCQVLVLDEGRQILVAAGSKGSGPAVTARTEDVRELIKAAKKPHRVPSKAAADPRFLQFYPAGNAAVQSFLSVPILHAGKTTGFVNCLGFLPARWSTDLLEFLAVVGTLAGSALANARLYEEAKRRSGRIEVLTQVSKTLTSGRYLEEILNLIVTMTAEMMGSKICSIMLLDEKKQELSIKATQSLSEAYRQKPPLKVSRSVSGLAVLERRPITVQDVRQDKRFVYSGIAQDEHLVSMLCVPMLVKDRVIGVINTYTPHEHIYSEDEINVMKAIASQAAIAIQNTLLMEDAVASREALEVRKLVERAKGILIRQHKIDEAEAYRLLQHQSMNLRKTMKEIAQAVILASEIKS